MERKLAGINEIERLTEELTLLGGDPEEIEKIVGEFEFTQLTLKIAIDKLMKDCNCKGESSSALECKRILEYEILVLNRSAIKF